MGNDLMECLSLRIFDASPFDGEQPSLKDFLLDRRELRKHCVDYILHVHVELFAPRDLRLGQNPRNAFHSFEGDAQTAGRVSKRQEHFTLVLFKVREEIFDLEFLRGVTIAGNSAPCDSWIVIA